MKTYHMSEIIHPVGLILKGNGLPKVTKEVEDALESHRPPDCLCRSNSVYTVNTPDFSELGIEAGYIYLVEIEGDFRPHDAYWVGQLQLAHNKSKHSQNLEYIAKHWPDWTDDLVSRCSIKYWAREASKKPHWEFLSTEAIVRKQISTCIVKAAATKGGWRLPDDA